MFELTKEKTPTVVAAGVLKFKTGKGNKLMNNNIALVDNNQLTMSSLEIADLTGSRHDSVKRAVTRLSNRGVIQLPPLVKVKNNQSVSNNKLIDSYLFEGEQGKRDSIIVVAQLYPEFTARLVDRWQELESQVKTIDPMQALNDPVTMRGLLLGYTEKVIALEHQVEELSSKAAFHDQVAVAPDAIDAGKAAKILGTGRNRLLSYLRSIGWITRYNEPYQDKIEQGLLDVKLGGWKHPDHGVMQSVTTLVTGKGLTKLSQMISGGLQ